MYIELGEHEDTMWKYREKSRTLENRDYIIERTRRTKRAFRTQRTVRMWETVKNRENVENTENRENGNTQLREWRERTYR